MSEEIKMNIEKADYGTIVKFGTLKDLHEKIISLIGQMIVG